MSSPDSRFICSSDLEGYMNDKLTGYPLAAGVVKFYQDSSRSIPKTVYQLSGSPGAYTFTALGTQLTLNSVGSYQDNLGNCIPIYYFPYHCTIDGDPTTSTGAAELYYVTVENSGGTQQFTRSAWPPLAGNLSPLVNGNTGVKNYIPNGQFLSHNNNPITDTTTQAGLDLLPIAQGGWYWKKTTGGTGTYTISFIDTSTGRQAGLNDYPFAAVNVNCTFKGTESVHDLVIQWPDVNVLQTLKATAPNAGSQINTFNLLFAAKVTSGSQNFTIHLISNYGTGGSAQIDNTIDTVAVTSNYAYFNVSIAAADLPDNTLSTVGAGNFFAIAIRFPNNAVEATFTDFALTLDNTVTYSAFPLMTEDEMLSRGVAGWMPTPNPDGSDLYLPLILTDQGMKFDHSQIGQIVAGVRSAVNNELICDGTPYVTSAFNPTTGIPYSRLQSVLFDSTAHVPIFGTGSTFATMHLDSGANTNGILYTNQAGSQTAPVDGATPTNFNFATELYAGATSISYNAYACSNAQVIAISTFTTATNSGNGVNANTSGFSVGDLNQPGVSGKYYIFSATTVSAAALTVGAGLDGKFFSFSNGTTNYFMWFNVVGEVQPAAGIGTAIEVKLRSTMTAADVAIAVANAIGKHQADVITFGAASTFNGGAYFTFHANSAAYNVWYKKDGVGTPPAGTSIEVDVAAGDDAATVAAATRTAINSYQFAVPDLRGVFLRGGSGGWDIDHNSYRYSYPDNLVSDQAGTFEPPQFTRHNHLGSTVSISSTAGPTQSLIGPGTAPDAQGSHSLAIADDGGSETRPVNMYVNYFIKY